MKYSLDARFELARRLSASFQSFASKSLDTDQMVRNQCIESSSMLMNAMVNPRVLKVNDICRPSEERQTIQMNMRILCDGLSAEATGPA